MCGVPQDAWTLACRGHQGLPEHVVVDGSGAQHWALSGSSRGYLSVWDVRFQMCVHTWQHPTR